MRALFSLHNKVALVTGAARGNGRAIAEGLLEAGAIVYFLDILKNRLFSISRTIRNNRAHFIFADITDFKAFANILKKIYSQEKRIDILVNNAGISLPEHSDTYSQEKWEKTNLVNLKAPFSISQLAAKYMKKTGGGAIVNITSLGSELGFSCNPAYVASKGGLKQLSKALAKDWAKYNIRVNNLGLGYFKTEMTKRSWKNKALRRQRTDRIMLRRWGEGRDLVGPVIFLASDASGYITGQDLYVDGGWLANGL